MTKTTERREKELGGGISAHLFVAWDSLTSKVRKDLDPATYNNIAALAKRYDAALDKFAMGIDKKGKSKGGFEKLWQDLRKMDQQIDELTKTIGKLNEESFATVKTTAGDSADDMVANWEEMLKRAQDVTKQFKGYFDHFNKLNESYDKQIADALGKVRSQLDGAKGELNKTNNELNALEAQIRGAVIAAEGAAVKQNKPDVAKAVKAVLKEFGV